MLFYPANYEIVVEALKKAGRAELIGYGPQCLIRPRKEEGQGRDKKVNKKKKTIRNMHRKQSGKGRR